MDGLADGTSRQLGRFSGIDAKAMDGASKGGLVPGPEHASPRLHRLFKARGFFSTL